MKKVLSMLLVLSLVVGMVGVVPVSASAPDLDYRLGYSTPNGYTTIYSVDATANDVIEVDIFVLTGNTSPQIVRHATKDEIEADNIGSQVHIINGGMVYKSSEIRYRSDDTAYLAITFSQYYTGNSQVSYGLLVYLTENDNLVVYSEVELTGTYTNSNSPEDMRYIDYGFVYNGEKDRNLSHWVKDFEAGPGDTLIFEIVDFITETPVTYEIMDRDDIGLDVYFWEGEEVFGDAQIKYRGENAYVEYKFSHHVTGDTPCEFDFNITLTRADDHLEAYFIVWGEYLNTGGGSIIGGGIGGGGGSTGGSSGGGGGSSGGGSRADGSGSSGGGGLAAVSLRSANVSTDGKVIQQSILSELQKELGGSADNAIVRTRGAVSISAATLRGMAAAGNNAGKQVMLYADTLNAAGKVQGRLYVDPAKLAGRKDDLLLGVYTESAKTASVAKKFEGHFSNKVAVVSLEQQGSLGATLQVAAKVDLGGLDTSSLVFYAYDRANNGYQLLEGVSGRVDTNGYLRFTTSQGGYIVITDKPLERK